LERLCGWASVGWAKAESGGSDGLSYRLQALVRETQLAPSTLSYCKPLGNNYRLPLMVCTTFLQRLDTRATDLMGPMQFLRNIDIWFYTVRSQRDDYV
jgi:hypothetical protein